MTNFDKFPDVPGRALNPSGKPRRFWLWWLSFLVIGIILVALRTPGAWSHPAFYAEDGQIFFTQQLQNGVGLLFQPYNGYFHLVPRLIALFASPFPVYYQPLIYAASSAVLQALAASFFSCLRTVCWSVLTHSAWQWPS
jgi:uncharacterized membrane protein YhaH (DUF805 family)